jgi:uncharacterized membrane protein
MKYGLNLSIKHLKLSVIFAVTFALSGCTSLEVVAFIGSSVTYFVSGKSWTDHAVSAVTQQDCAMDRIIQGKVICVPVNDPERVAEDAVAVEVASVAEIIEKPVEILESPLVESIPAVQEPSSSLFSETSESNMFAVLGSYTNPEFAEDQLKRYARFEPSLTQSTYQGSTRYRVIVGPLATVDDYQLLQHALPELAEQMWRTEVSSEQRERDSLFLASR